MVGGFVDLTVDAVAMVDTELIFKTRNQKQSHPVVEVEEDGAGWAKVGVDGCPVYLETCGMIYLRIEQRRISSPAALYTQTLDGIE